MRDVEPASMTQHADPLSALPVVQRQVDAGPISAEGNNIDLWRDATPTNDPTVQRDVATEIGGLPSFLWDDIGMDAPVDGVGTTSDASTPQQNIARSPIESEQTDYWEPVSPAMANDVGHYVQQNNIPAVQRAISNELFDESGHGSRSLSLNQASPMSNLGASPPVVQRSSDTHDPDSFWMPSHGDATDSADVTQHSESLSGLPFVQRQAAESVSAETPTNIQTDFGELPTTLWNDIGLSAPLAEPAVQREVATEIGSLPATLWSDLGVTAPSAEPATVQRQPIIDHISAESPDTVQRKITQDGTSTPVGEDSSADEQEESLLEDPEDEANDEEDVDIEELSRKVYQKIRHRIAIEWERGRGY